MNNFYLTGGTALSAFYLEHRLSMDLDFFTDSDEKMPRIEYLTGALKKGGVEDIRFERLYDRRIFELIFSDKEVLKLEFTVYPFKSLQDRKKIGRLEVDSLLNIVTGKLIALTDRYDPKDLTDIYFILISSKLRLIELIRKTEQRFGIKGLDFIIPERLMLVKKITQADLPQMLIDFDLQEMKKYLLTEAVGMLQSRGS